MNIPSNPLFKLRIAAGFTIVETLFAVGIAGISLAGIMMLNSQQLRLVKSTQATNAAALCLQERAEQLRGTTWDQITSPTFLTTGYFATAPRSASPLPDFTEQITVSAYPDPTVSRKLTAKKRKGVTAQLLENGTELARQEMARVDFEIHWTGDNGRPRSRQFVTIVSNGGINRSNLPAMGSAAGAVPGTTEILSATTAPETTAPAPVLTLPVSTATPAPSKGRRGSIGGKTGKK